MSGQGKRKRVVIHEDDVGMSHGANSAFVELSKLGSCSSGSVMVPCPWFPEAAEIARNDKSRDVGVHLTLTSEQKPYRWRPLTAPPPSAGLTDKFGYFCPLDAKLGTDTKDKLLPMEGKDGLLTLLDKGKAGQQQPGALFAKAALYFMSDAGNAPGLLPGSVAVTA